MFRHCFTFGLLMYQSWVSQGKTVTHPLPISLRRDYDLRHGQTKCGWQAQVARRVGTQTKRKAKTFKSKREAQVWAREFEAELDNGTTSRDTVASVFDRYARDRSAGKKGRRREEIRLNRFKTDVANGKPLGEFLIGEITRADLVAWRDTRLSAVSRPA
ncbi:MAG: hypothetical protein CML66_28400 [Rhodobacteraceae bacterium]|nr:hypothetical protein [Paracoccaceae bacterium]